MRKARTEARAFVWVQNDTRNAFRTTLLQPHWHSQWVGLEFNP